MIAHQIDMIADKYQFTGFEGSIDPAGSISDDERSDPKAVQQENGQNYIIHTVSLIVVKPAGKQGRLLTQL
ncbi:hypothetical protein ES703_89523 [subsurface metagenome]